MIVKRIIYVLLCLVMVCSLCACDQNSDQGDVGMTSQKTSTSTDPQSSNINSSSATSLESKNEVTPEELDALLLEQPMYVQSTKYVVQDEKYKTLYPDFLQAVVKNNSGTDVKNLQVAFVAWDKNNFPVKIYGNIDFDGSYVKICQYSDVNMLNGTSYGKEGGLAIDAEKSDIATFKAIVVSYDDFDGNTWDNPYYETWVDLYSDKKLN